MAKGARILGETLLFSGRFRLTRTRVAIEEANGAVRGLEHEIYHYKQAAAVLLYDAEREVVLLVKQFRLGAFLGDGALDLIEVCAGMLDEDAPEDCARREAWEEAGVRLSRLDHAFDAFMSPGGMTEKIACFVAPYGAEDRLGVGGGVDADEHIELLEMRFDDALARISRGEIRDAKTIALLYYARATGLM
jgi:nudix-type nucleoside diphosphatase (YffH/AdpP family)